MARIGSRPAAHSWPRSWVNERLRFPTIFVRPLCIWTAALDATDGRICHCSAHNVGPAEGMKSGDARVKAAGSGLLRLATAALFV